MIRDADALRRFEDEMLRRSPQPSFLENLRLFEAMWEEARSLGIFPPSDPLDGLEGDIELARILNCSKNSSPA
jgi:hypothetical protein